MTDDAPALVDAYSNLSAQIKRLEARRAYVRAQLLLAVDSAPGLHHGGAATVRVSVLPTTRFPAGPTMERLTRAQLLPEVATVSALRLRRALDERDEFDSLLSDIVQRVDLPYVAAVPN